MSEQRCATVAIVGAPNAGKSSLLNAIVGSKLSIVSPKPQATRQPVVGVDTRGDTQLILADQPGLMDPDYPLHTAMRQAALAWLGRSDLILHLYPAPIEGAVPALPDLIPEVEDWRQPVARVRTMADRLPEPWPDGDTDSFYVSARTGAGLDPLLAWCRDRAPRRPWDRDPDDLSTQPERFFVTEFVREAAFEQLGQELPYSVAAEVDEFREGSDPIYIRVTVFVERETQKRMVIGKGGRTIKALGQSARVKIEELLGRHIYLDLWVKTLPKWRSTPNALARFGLALDGKGER